MNATPTDAGFRRELGLVDAAVIVAGAMVGVGIFANPSNVARILGDPRLILIAWIAGGAIALLAGFAYAELGSRVPLVGGQYRYLAEAYHPIVGFLYGVALLFIINGGSLAAVSIVFGSYVDAALAPLGPRGIHWAAAAAILTLTAINAIGIQAGKWTNNALMAAKVGGIIGLIVLAGAYDRPAAATLAAPSIDRTSMGLLLTALIPVMFAYGGWQNCAAVAAEIRDPARTLARATVIGVATVVILYVGLNVAYLLVLPAHEVAASTAVAVDVARRAAGEAGARFVALLIVLSSLGLISVVVMTGPRIYYAMAVDGLLFRRAARLHPRFRTPAFTLWLQALVVVTLIATNTYDQLLSYVVFADWLFFGLTAGTLFVYRRRQRDTSYVFSMPGYPWTTIVFIGAAAAIVLNSFVAYPRQSLAGTGILAAAAAFYLVALQRSGRAFVGRRL